MTELDDPAIAADTLLCVQLVARRHDDPTAYGPGAALCMVELLSPALVGADR